jgi:nucleoside-diphosphate-sugar epimerase
MSGQSVSITGATGFLGWHLSESFRDRGWRVTAIVRPDSRKPTPADVERAQAALDPVQLAEACAGCSVIVHGAAIVRAASAQELDAINVAGTRAAVKAANRVGARLLLISSQAAAGPGTPSHPTREDDDPHPITPYGRSKLAAEQIVRDLARVPWTIVRPSAVYGPRDRAFLPVFRLASKGVFVHAGPRDTAYTITHVTDVARAIALAAESGRAIGRALFIGHHVPVTERAMLEGLAGVFGRRYRSIRVPGLALKIAAEAGELAWRFGRQPIVDRARLAELRAGGFVCAVDQARDALDFTAEIDLREGLAQTAAWYREAGWLS